MIFSFLYIASALAVTVSAMNNSYTFDNYS